MKDITTREDIELLVNSFYDKVKKDEIIGFFFNDIAKTNWQTHLPKMYNFWQALLFADIKFEGNPMGAHFPINAQAPMEEYHFEHWLKIWKETVDELFAGEMARMPKTELKILQK